MRENRCFKDVALFVVDIRAVYLAGGRSSRRRADHGVGWEPHGDGRSERGELIGCGNRPGEGKSDDELVKHDPANRGLAFHLPAGSLRQRGSESGRHHGGSVKRLDER